MEAYAFQMPNQVSNLTDDEELMEAAPVSLETANVRRLRERLDNRKVHLYFHLLIRSRSIWNDINALHTRTTLCQTWLYTHRTRCGI